MSTTNVSLREVCQVGTSSKQPVDDLTQSSVRHVTVANAVSARPPSSVKAPGLRLKLLNKL